MKHNEHSLRTYHSLRAQVKALEGVEASKGDEVESSVHGVVDANNPHIPAGCTHTHVCVSVCVCLSLYYVVVY